jgi:hypothetical protein
MLKINIGLSRKLSENFNSNGFSLNLEGELCVDLRDTETVVERIQEYYDLAEEALNRQIERYESDSAIARRDTEPQVLPVEPQRPRTTPVNRLPNSMPQGESATNKQIQFLLNLGKRQGLNKSQLEDRITERFARKATIYELTKREAGLMIDSLTSQVTTAANA